MGGQDEEDIKTTATGEEKQEEEEDVETMRRKVQELKEEADRIEQLTDKLEQRNSTIQPTIVDKQSADARSVFVGNVDYSTTAEELQAHFKSCGVIHRVTIQRDHFTSHPKGFAYIEFADSDSATNALVLNETLFKGRQLKVTPKRTNLPGMNKRGGRGRRRFMGRRRAPSYHYQPY